MDMRVVDFGYQLMSPKMDWVKMFLVKQEYK